MNTRKGYKLGAMSEKHKRKISEAHKSLGLRHWSHRPEVKAKLVKTLRSNNWLGKKRPDISGSNHYLYNPFLSAHLRLRYCLKYRQWRCDVFERDNYTCQICGIRGVYIEADHIKAFSQILSDSEIETFDEGLLCEELWNINNGRTLCKECHKTTDNYQGKAKRGRKYPKKQATI